MNENTINPFLKAAQGRLHNIKAFLEQAKTDAVEPPSDSVYVHPALNDARRIVIGHKQAVELLKNTYQLYEGLRAHEISEIQAKAYIFSTGVDLAIRSMAPFLIVSSGLIKKLLRPDRVDLLAQRIREVFGRFSPADVDGLLEYLKKVPMASGFSEKKLRRKLSELLNQKSYPAETEAEAHDEALKDLGYNDEDIPGYLLILGYMSGLVTSKAISELINEP